jgi:hypothetical protein
MSDKQYNISKPAILFSYNPLKTNREILFTGNSGFARA